ncbi:MAG TPA: BON domain-containing protein [Acidimicrobiales bacterium]|nr:BON domain-containing protein [Acidimicrobiales bacterium]
MAENDVAGQIQQRLRDQYHMFIVAAQQGDTIMLSGRVGSDQDRNTAERVARELGQGRPVQNLIEVQPTVTEGLRNPNYENAGRLDPSFVPGDEIAQSPPVILESEGLDAGFDQVPLETDSTDVVDESVYDDVPPVEPDPAYFAPTDPVVEPDRQGNLQVVGGWDPTSMSSDTVDPSAEDNQPGDEALADAIRRELREDASTNALQLDVEVERGVAHLRGTVTDLTDAENAESVASQVPGVREVIDETTVQSL